MPQTDSKCIDWIRKLENLFISNVSPHNLSFETYLQSVHTKHSNIIFQSLVTRSNLKFYSGFFVCDLISQVYKIFNNVLILDM